MKKTTTTLKPSDYVHLHNHTHYSLLDGLQKVPEMLDQAKELGMQAIAMTDHGTLSGLIEFYKEARARDIKPIFGIETYVAPRSHQKKDPQRDKTSYHLILLAMNKVGYENLLRLSTIANLEGFYYKPRVDRELIERHNEGLIALSGCIGGEVGDALRSGDYEGAKEAAGWYASVFGDRYYLELQDHGHQWDEQARVNKQLLKLAKELHLPCVVTADAHYLHHTDQEAHEVLLCVQTGSYLSDDDRMSLKNTDLFLSDPKEIIDRWGASHPELISNTREIADRCNVDIELGRILIPSFAVPAGETEESYLRKLAYRGLAWRYGGVAYGEKDNLSETAAKRSLAKEIIQRGEYELEVITRMGFCGYFLIVSDFINWGKDQGIVFGPGRGSAAGSIISYALRITELDPLEYDLLFERFLNPDRVSMPDIDIDIQDSLRSEVIQYVVDKYGQDRVAHIVTFGTMAARNAIRDVARVLEVPYAEADRLAKLVPPPFQGRHIPLADSIKNDPELKSEYENNQQSKRVIDLALRLEGTIRSHGVHAAGVVIGPDELVTYTPLEMAQKGVITTQYSMGPIEELGLLKMDFLGLSNLTIIKNALRIIRKVYNQELDVADLPIDDETTYKLLGRGETTGVFQLESAGMKRYIKELKPTRFEDIVAMVALYRPGPMQFIDDFIDRKHGRKKIEYVHQKMQSALENTYGVLVYQEQVMQLAKEMCGFSGGQSDTLRKAIGKKIASLMARMKADFIEGGVKHSKVDRKDMVQLWKQLEAFASYAFPKAHAACYALIAYQTAFLKANYPAAFMAALMTSDFDDTDRLAIEINECKKMDIEVLPPDVNESFLEFAVMPGDGKNKKKDAIRFGMAAIKNVGTAAVEEILRAREEGKFTDIADFAKRVNNRIVNRKAWESLIKAGAFDQLGERDDLLFNLDTITAYSAKVQRESSTGQTDLFGASLKSSLIQDLAIEKAPSTIGEREKLQWERDLLGLYLSKHPLEVYARFLAERTVPISQLKPGTGKKRVVVGGIINTVRQIVTKNGQKMAFVSISDMEGTVELIVFPSVFSANYELWQVDRVVEVKGTLSSKDRDGKATEELKVLVDEVVEVNEEAAKQSMTLRAKPAAPADMERPKRRPQSPLAPVNKKRLFIHLKDAGDSNALLSLKKMLNQFPGTTEAILVIGVDKQKSAVKLPFRIEASAELQSKLADLLTPEAVTVK